MYLSLFCFLRPGMLLSINSTAYRARSFNARPQNMAVAAIVLHSGEGSKASDLEALTGLHVSAHYYVDRIGTIYQLLDPALAAWHAGESNYLGRRAWNNFSVGIETEHRAGQNWPLLQRLALIELCRMLIVKYNIAESMIVAHRWIAIPSGRKADPTDWPDDELHAWIGHLYPGKSVDWSLWGSAFPLPADQHGYGIPTGWAKQARELGPATSLPIYDGAGRAVQWFAFGIVVWQAGHNHGVGVPILFKDML